LFVDAAKGGNTAAGVRQDFFDLRVLARNAGDSLAGGRPRKVCNPKSIFRKSCRRWWSATRSVCAPHWKT
jgi:hypothetical protein